IAEAQPRDDAPVEGVTARLVDGGRLATLSALADPGNVEFHSHRASIGRAVIFVKRVLRRLLTPILDRQAAFNRAVLQAFAGLDEDLGRRLEANERRLGRIERRLLVLEEAIARTGAVVPTEAAFDYAAFEDA